jgi:hypothetical protein
MDDFLVQIGAPVAVDDWARNNPDMRKESDMRNGLAKATTAPIQLVSPAAASTPRVECIITTMTMQNPLA